MKKLLIIGLLFTLYLQVTIAQVPAIVHATWTPNPAADSVVQYQITVDSTTPVTTLASACTPTLCSQTLTIPTFGLHNATLVAQNLKFVGDPTSLQSSAPTTISFTLAAVPVVVAGFKITS